jgi:hypothetical protein
MDWQARYYPPDIFGSLITKVEELNIPDVCRDLGIPCINLLGLMRREKWTF